MSVPLSYYGMKMVEWILKLQDNHVAKGYRTLHGKVLMSWSIWSAGKKNADHEIEADESLNCTQKAKRIFVNKSVHIILLEGEVEGMVHPDAGKWSCSSTFFINVPFSIGFITMQPCGVLANTYLIAGYMIVVCQVQNFVDQISPGMKIESIGPLVAIIDAMDRNVGSHGDTPFTKRLWSSGWTKIRTDISHSCSVLLEQFHSVDLLIAPVDLGFPGSCLSYSRLLVGKKSLSAIGTERRKIGPGENVSACVTGTDHVQCLLRFHRIHRRCVAGNGTKQTWDHALEESRKVQAPLAE